MATNAGQPTISLNDRLLARGDRYSFFQATRLLNLLTAGAGKIPSSHIRTRPALGMGFPNTDIQQIEAFGQDDYRITANFLGLYGVTSPLPTHYTESLLEQAADGFSVNREFLDVFAQSIYPIFFKAWLKPRASLRVMEYQDSRMLEILYAFVGIPSISRRQQHSLGPLLQCGAFFNQQVRSAAGLQAMLEASLRDVRVRVRQLQKVWVEIAEDQQNRLGLQACRLGEDSHLGGYCGTFSGVTISLSDIDKSLFRQLIPGGKAYERLRFLISNYVTSPLPIRVELTLRDAVAKPTTLSGDTWGRLGLDTWLLPERHDGAVSMSFELPIRSSALANLALL